MCLELCCIISRRIFKVFCGPLLADERRWTEVQYTRERPWASVLFCSDQ